MPSFEKFENLPAELPPKKVEAEIISSEELPDYEPLGQLSPDQAKELMETGRTVNALNDVYEIVHAFPNDMHGKKEAIENLLLAASNLITAYRSEDTDTVAKSSAFGGMRSLRDSLRGFGFKADEQQEMINRVYGS
jgi:hypothetical protein